MIIRNNNINKIVRYNGFPVQVRNRYNTVGYIPTMTSNTTPAPYVASNFGDTSLQPVNAFDNDENIGSYIAINCSSKYPLSYVQITLDRPISIWRIRVYSFCMSYSEAGTNYEFYVSDGDDNKICDLDRGAFTQYRNTITTLAQPTARSQYYRVAIKLTGMYSWSQRIYTFQIYPYD